MQIKKKMCAGWDENSHSAFIWKKIKGKPYCKSCTYKLEGIKSITKVSAKQKIKNNSKAEQTQLRKKMFLDIWSKLTKKNCWSCNAYLGEEPLSIFFDHLVEKSKHPELDLVKENIYICCVDCHTKKTMGNPTEAHKKAIKEAKLKLL
jgi:5-methylcytosine-specific restriction endonuclease McrA